MTHTARRPGADDPAVSSVLGAILMFGLLVVTLLTVQTEFVPRWDEDREARQSDRVVDQLSLFKSDTERLATNATAGTVTDALTMSTKGGFSFFKSAQLGGTATFAPSAPGQGVVLSSPLLRIVRRDGDALFALGENWVAIPSNGTVTDIQDVNHLRVRIVDPNSNTGGETATLSIVDADGAYAGKAVITLLRDASERSIQTEVFSSASSTTAITIQRESYFHQVNPAFVYVNLLDDELLFRQVLAAAETPFDLVLTTTGLTADYTVAYIDSTGGSSGGSGGLSIPNYSSTLASGTLAYESRFQILPEQTFIIEHGAILVEQDDGAAMVVPPSLNVATTDDRVVLDLVIPGLDGEDAAIGGQRAASLVGHGTGARTHLEALAARLSFTLPTDHPDVWADYLDTAFSLAGLSDLGVDPQYNVTQTATSVTVNLFGPVSAPADTTEDIFLRYQQATIDFDLRPSG